MMLFWRYRIFSFRQVVPKHGSMATNSSWCKVSSSNVDIIPSLCSARFLINLSVMRFMPFLGGGYLSSASGSGTQMPSLVIVARRRRRGARVSSCYGAVGRAGRAGAAQLRQLFCVPGMRRRLERCVKLYYGPLAASVAENARNGAVITA